MSHVMLRHSGDGHPGQMGAETRLDLRKHALGGGGWPNAAEPAHSVFADAADAVFPWFSNFAGWLFFRLLSAAFAVRAARRYCTSTKSPATVAAGVVVVPAKFQRQ
jgi:hypothetical protein